ncbi:carbohydrate porin [Sodalis sp. dw_96]|uniref:carbohydrate porin n=1 Tax=Sodalis sp. dw_96 TaxID=2719794 RepID=UPI001BD460C0|nr:carbohydrate porin [Sodalis sp. dw_96]
MILGLNLDLDKIANIPDTQFYVGLGEREGRDITNDRIHDPKATGLTSAMEIYGGGTAWRLSQLYYEQKLMDKKLSVKFQLMFLTFFLYKLQNIVIEINYEYQATKWLMIRPNLQYTKKPGALKKLMMLWPAGCSLL